jgi:hypothetical protein
LADTPTATSTPIDTPFPTFTATPIPLPTDATPPEIGTTPDGVVYNIPAGGTLTLGINLAANGDPGFDLVYYEFPSGSGIWLDWVIIEISDGNNWYTIFNWYDNNADTNSNMNFNILSLPVPPPFAEEIDERDILAADLYTSSSGISTGIAINIDIPGVVPGTYSYIRFSAPAGDVDGHMEIDAIETIFP